VNGQGGAKAEWGYPGPTRGRSAEEKREEMNAVEQQIDTLVQQLKNE